MASKYRQWLGDGLNNAKLGSVATYHDLVPAFAALLAAADGDLGTFYAAADALAALSRDQRRTTLQRLSRRAKEQESDPAVIDEAS